MFLEFYGLREQPFGVTPDPRFLYLSPAHREALASVYYGIVSGRGLLALIAKPGMGKTTLLFSAAAEIARACAHGAALSDAVRFTGVPALPARRIRFRRR